MPQETKSKSLPDGQQDAHETLQGAMIDCADADQLRHAIDLAFNYRGDVTIVRKTDGSAVEGYIFDRRSKPALADSMVRVIPKDGSPRVSVCYSDIAALTFSGKDTAAGKSFDTWIRKYVQKKLAGQSASIDSESLE